MWLWDLFFGGGEVQLSSMLDKTSPGISYKLWQANL